MLSLNRRESPAPAAQAHEPAQHQAQQPDELHWTPELAARYWAHLAQDSRNYFGAQRGRDIVRHLARFVPQRARILDYGCGPGHLLPELSARGYAATGADEIPAAARSANDNLYTIGELLERGETFDAVLMVEVVARLYDAELPTAFWQAKRLLKHGGRLIITTPCQEDLTAGMVFCPVSNLTFHRRQHVRSWSAESLAAALFRARLPVERVEALTFRSNAAMRNPLTRLAATVWAKMKPPMSLMAVARS